MIRLASQAAVMAIIALVACSERARAGNWTDPVEVRHDLKRLVSYRARLDGGYLVVEATHEPGWHTCAMDNKRRAEEKLAGRQSLGIDAPTEITVTQGLEVAGPWYQTPPKDLSKPDLLWFTWGFEGQAVFAAKVRRAGTGPALIQVRGQACSETTCKQVDIELRLPLGGVERAAAPSGVDLKKLVPVRR